MCDSVDSLCQSIKSFAVHEPNRIMQLEAAATVCFRIVVKNEEKTVWKCNSYDKLDDHWQSVIFGIYRYTEKQIGRVLWITIYTNLFMDRENEPKKGDLVVVRVFIRIYSIRKQNDNRNKMWSES